MKVLEVNNNYRWVISRYDDEYISCQLENKRHFLGFVYYGHCCRKILIKLNDGLPEHRLNTGLRIHIYPSYEIHPNAVKGFLKSTFESHIKAIQKRANDDKIITNLIDSI